MKKTNYDTVNESNSTVAHTDGAIERRRLELFDEYRSLLFSIAYRTFGTVADAEHMLQEAFLLWQALPLDEIGSPAAFLVTIISRLCISHLQSARLRREECVALESPRN